MKFSSADVLERVDVTVRQLDYWCRIGLIGDHVKDRGYSGWRRQFDEHDLEVIDALAASTRLGAPISKLGSPDFARAVAEAVRASRVSETGEWLVITADGSTRRCLHLCLDRGTPFDAARCIRLRAFTDRVVGESADVAPSVVEPPASAPDSSATEPRGIERSPAGAERERSVPCCRCGAKTLNHSAMCWRCKDLEAAVPA